MTYETPELKPDKGLKGGSCNVTRCQKPGANYFNKGTEKYYCAECAEGINWPGGRADAMRLYGSPLLCEIPPEGVDPIEELRKAQRVLVDAYQARLNLDQLKSDAFIKFKAPVYDDWDGFDVKPETVNLGRRAIKEQIRKDKAARIAQRKAQRV